MTRSRMLTFGFRLFFGFAIAFWGAAFLAALGGNLVNTDQGPMDSVLGPLSVGWKGGVGNHVAFSVLLTASAASGLIGGMLIAFRDADAEAQAQVLRSESLPLTRAPFGVSFAPLAIALLGVAVLVGLAAGSPLVYVAGIGIIGAAFVWLVRAWSNRATGDDATNSEIYHRFMDPLRLPVVSLILIGFVVVGLSRILLAAPSAAAAVVIFSVVGGLFFLAAIGLSARPQIPRNVQTLVVVAGALIILGLAIAGLAIGEREFKDYSQEGAVAPMSSEVYPA
ncbi:MAG: hypothetical protein JJU45_11685 [Acidimicrobiia bacterium]|nr:hypothetical protein [Acidimicrobiia bacterium]